MPCKQDSDKLHWIAWFRDSITIIATLKVLKFKYFLELPEYIKNFDRGIFVSV